ncbi:uncharacterized protein L3040_009043 [Drepanopeziza brunnea f. sp. 'multigermtubi']|uniref:uncharacterized protein n=1 Tax=Drepanopeziza brunnea f. sp. 'multigermtubi' TaxID=698441 RepID=UPI00239BD79C|nr:hypothetical protein L3040_009043 [Drepanopeziza brunnea f. sp. 'multigermtubi']
MKVAFVSLVSALASLGHAQFSGLPSCATPCVLEYTTGGGQTIAGCDRLSVDCICANDSFLDSIACCLVKSCTKEEQTGVVTFAQNICSANGVTDLPTSIVCDSSTGNGSTSATPSASPSAASSAAAPAAASPTPTAGAAPKYAAGIGAGVLGGLLAAVMALL